MSDRQLTVSDIHKIQKSRLANRNEAFDAVLEQCNRRIKKYVEVLKDTTACIYEVPEMLVGYPLYKLNDCIVHLVNALEKNGFKIAYCFPRYLVISWGAVEASKMPKNVLQFDTTTKPKKNKKPTTGLNLY